MKTIHEKKIENNFSHYLDLASHTPITTEQTIQKICAQVIEYDFNSSFMNPYYIVYARQFFKNHSPEKRKVGTVISFPLGQETAKIKMASAHEAAALGADELDISLNVALIKEARWEKVLEEMSGLVQTARAVNSNIIVKFIPETGYLTPVEIQKVAEIMVESGADFFKTCSGMGPRGATLEDVYLVRDAIGHQIKIKVAGGISTYEQARAFIDAGADRIGTSKAVEIITEFKKLT